MKLSLQGFDSLYALEQISLMLFPDGKTTVDGENAASCRVSQTERFITVSVDILYRDKIAHARCRVGYNETDRIAKVNRAIRVSFFRAAVRILGYSPSWGALSGVRPVKLARREAEGCSDQKKIAAAMSEKYFLSPEKADLVASVALNTIEHEKRLGSGDISVYVGIPFCPTRCVYCSFVTSSLKAAAKTVEPYLEVLHKEIDHAGKLIKQKGFTVKSVYIGGGTPTSLTADQLRALMEKISSSLDLSDMEEYTVEAGRPDTIDLEKLVAFKEYGVTRVSVNPQSMDEGTLKTIGRVHTPGDCVRAYEMVRRAGIRDVNMDLIAGLPGESAEVFACSLIQVAALKPENVTVHTLALKKGSELRRSAAGVCDMHTVGDMLAAVPEALHKYRPYYLYRQKYMEGSFENVGYCLPGRECLYNIYIMEELHSIISLGAGGVTKLVSCGTIKRTANPKYPFEYIGSLDKIITDKERLFGL